MLDAGARDAQRRARHRGEPDQRADLDVIGPDRIAAAAERRWSVHDHGIGADALDAGAKRDQEMREVLHMRLGSDVAQMGGAVRRHRGHQRVFGGGHAGLVEKNVGADEARGAEFQPVGCDHGGAELFERQEMGVEPAPADDVAAGRRQHHLAAAGQQRPGQQDRGADPRAQHRIEIGGANVSWRGSQAYCGRCHSTEAPTERISSTSVSVSRIRGTFSSVTGCSVSNAAAMIGSAAFLLPDGSMVPVSRWPPSTMYWIGGTPPYTSTLALSELSWMNSRRGSTTSPISLVKMSSASSTSLILTCSIERSLVSSVVSQSWPGFISPRPL